MNVSQLTAQVLIIWLEQSLLNVLLAGQTLSSLAEGGTTLPLGFPFWPKARLFLLIQKIIALIKMTKLFVEWGSAMVRRLSNGPGNFWYSPYVIPANFKADATCYWNLNFYSSDSSDEFQKVFATTRKKKALCKKNKSCNFRVYKS